MPSVSLVAHYTCSPPTFQGSGYRRTLPRARSGIASSALGAGRQARGFEPIRGLEITTRAERALKHVGTGEPRVLAAKTADVAAHIRVLDAPDDFVPGHTRLFSAKYRLGQWSSWESWVTCLFTAVSLARFAAFARRDTVEQTGSKQSEAYYVVAWRDRSGQKDQADRITRSCGSHGQWRDGDRL